VLIYLISTSFVSIAIAEKKSAELAAKEKAAEAQTKDAAEKEKAAKANGKLVDSGVLSFI